jgi:glycosyltransferase involved in cell wall biosynthesis
MMTLPWYQWLWVAAHGGVLLFLCVFGFHRYVVLFRYLRHRRNGPPAVPPLPREALPTVTVQLPMYNERFVVERLLDAVAALDYPAHLLEIQVLDDSTDDTTVRAERKVAELRARGLDIRLIHRKDRSGFKAGALQHGLAKAKGEFIYILDADFLPEPDALLRLLPRFSDPAVGMVQTRWGHLNREQSALTRVQSILLDGHFLLEQGSRSRSGKFFHFNGTAGMWRKRCIEDAGGWEPDTLTEDLDLSFRAQMKGWRFVYLNDVVTPAELPADMNAFKVQQHRWTKGAIQNAMKWLLPVWRADLPLPVKLEATAQLTNNFVYLFMVLLLFLLMPIPGLVPDWSWGAVPGAIIFLVGTCSVVVFYAATALSLYPSRWARDLLHVPLLLALGVGLSLNNARGVLEALRGKPSVFVRTPKSGGSSGPRRYRSNASVTTWLEGGLGLVFAVLAVMDASKGNWFSVPFQILFSVGFLFVSWPCLKKRGLPPSDVQPTGGPSHERSQPSDFPVPAVELGPAPDDLR